MSLDPSLLVLIEGENDAYRLIATWPRVGKGVGDDGSRGDFWSREWEQTVEAWSRASGVDPDVIAHWAPILFDNRLLGPGGTVDEDVHNVVRAAGAQRLRRGMGGS